jgi:hypothetical protein
MAKDDGKQGQADRAADQQAGTPGDAAAAAAAASTGTVEQARTDEPISDRINEAPEQAETRPGGDGYVSRLPELTIGAAGADVMLLARLLRSHGFDNPVARGEAAAVLDNALMDRVRAFQADRDVEPHTAEQGADQARFNARLYVGHVDARTWEALMGDRMEGYKQ